MGKVNFNEVQQQAANREGGNLARFFSLKNDGDEAIVRILHDSVDDFDLYAVHDVFVGQKRRKVNCLRDPQDPVEKCPLCEGGEKLYYRMYIHMIQYIRNDSGQIVAQPVVWERSASYANTLKNLIDEYGPLTDCIFKIKRSGAAGSKETSYSIMFGNPSIYKSEIYSKENLFEGSFKVLGPIVLNKTAEELVYFMDNGAFPEKEEKSAKEQIDVIVDDTPTEYDNPSTTAPRTLPWQTPSNTTAPNRPVRRY